MTAEDGPTTADRVRHVCSSHFVLAVGLCLLLAVGGAVVAVGAHTGPDTTTEQRVVATWTTDSGFDHAAVVQRDARPFDRGELLRNRSTYFSSVTPVLNGTYRYEHGGDADTARVTTDLTLVVRAVTRDSNGGVLWRETEPLASADTASVPADGAHRVPFQANVTERIEYGRAAREDLQTVRGRIEVVIVAETEAVTTLEGDRLVDERTEQIEISPEQGTYDVSVNASGPAQKPVSESVSVPVEADPVREYGSILIALLGVAGVAALVWTDRTGRLDVPSRVASAIAVQRERDSFDEWISVGHLPPGDEDRVVTLDSLEDLVDVAIDSDRRVIEDVNSSTYVVLDGETRYEFRSDTADHTGASNVSGARFGGSVRDDGDPVGAVDGDGADDVAADDGSSPPASEN
ncbi:DUF5305 domain-containing protein [Halosimplex amylolyticum]|uniref:DUF5305 domain-containing protein n=1 Tax=Halosimplex amylolyticum TaxID=3396616 RepID=UPI003F5783CF